MSLKSKRCSSASRHSGMDRGVCARLRMRHVHPRHADQTIVVQRTPDCSLGTQSPADDPGIRDASAYHRSCANRRRRTNVPWALRPTNIQPLRYGRVLRQCSPNPRAAPAESKLQAQIGRGCAAPGRIPPTSDVRRPSEAVVHTDPGHGIEILASGAVTTPTFGIVAE